MQAKKNVQIAWEKQAVPKHLYLFISVPWRFDCSLALRNFKISISSWTLGKAEAQTLCKYWSFESTNLCPIAWSTGPSRKGGGVVFWLRRSQPSEKLTDMSVHAWTCLTKPSRDFRICQIPDTSRLLARNQKGTARGSEGLGWRNKTLRGRNLLTEQKLCSQWWQYSKLPSTEWLPLIKSQARLFTSSHIVNSTGNPECGPNLLHFANKFLKRKLRLSLKTSISRSETSK